MGGAPRIIRRVISKPKPPPPSSPSQLLLLYVKTVALSPSQLVLSSKHKTNFQN